MSYCSIAVVFEDSYSKYQQRYDDDLLKTVKIFQKAANVGRDAIGFIIHSLKLPDEKNSGDVRNEVIQNIWLVFFSFNFSLVHPSRFLINSIKSAFSKTIFITGLSHECYTRFWNEWHLFVMDAAESKASKLS